MSQPASRPASRPASVLTSRPAPKPRSPAQVALFRFDARRSGRSRVTIPRQRPRLLWRFATKRPVVTQPLVDALGDVYVASLDGHVYALTKGGKLRWRHAVGARIFATPALAAQGLLVGADDETLRLLDLEDGRLRWRKKIGACAKLPGMGMDRVRCQIDASPLVAPGGAVAYVVSDALYAVDLRRGEIRWRGALPGHAFASPALGPRGRVVMGTKAMAVVALDSRAQGRQSWRWGAQYNCDATAAVAADAPLDVRVEPGRGVRNAPPSSAESMTVRRRGAVAYVGCDDGRLRAFALATGQELWSVRTRRRVESAAAIGPKGRIYFGSGDGRLRVVSPDGRLLWSFKTKGAIRAAPVVDKSGAVVVGSRDDRLYALDASGRLLWSKRLGGDIDAPVSLTSEGTLLVGCDDGGVYALR